MPNNTNVGRFTFVTEPYLLDFQGRTTLPMLGNYLMHAASSHADSSGYGYNRMQNNKTAWVLSRLAFEIMEYPHMSEEITILTWVESINRFFANRCFEIIDSRGKSLGFAHSLWVTIDLDTRRPVVIDPEHVRLVIADRPCPIERPIRMNHAPENETTKKRNYCVKYSDLDINKHHNSIKYIEHIVDMFDLELFTSKSISRFDISFLSEGHFGMEMAITSTLVGEDVYNMSIFNNDKEVCRAEAHWK